MDVASRPPSPHRPFGWTWLSWLQTERRASHLWWTLHPHPYMADHRLGCLSTIVLNIIADKLQVPFSAAMITDSWSIMGCYHRAFPQTQCQQHVNPGQKSCMWSVRWKAAMACRSHRVASQWRTPWAELESSGSCRFDWLCCWACWGST